MKLLILSLYLACLFIGCTESKKGTLRVTALSISAHVAGDILVGSSVLNDPNRFVCGGSVIKGNDNNYHMLYSTWECGDSLPEFKNSWVLHSKIASGEDPYVWYHSAHEKFYVVLKDFTGTITKGEPG